MTSPHGIRAAFFDLVDDPWLVEDEAAVRYLLDGLLVVEDGIITDFGAWDDIGGRHANLPVTAFPDRVVLPGFIDGHTHFPQARVVGAYGAHLLAWLDTYVYPEEILYADAAYARAGAQTFVDSALASGTTTFQSFCTTSPESVIAILDEADRRGMRAIAGLTGLDRHGPTEYLCTADEFYQGSRDLIARYHGKNRLLYAITPRFALGCSEAMLERAGQLHREHPDCWVNTHLSETRQEVRAVHGAFPDCADYLAVYEKYGLVGLRFSAGHSIWVSESEMQRLHDSGAAVVFCPCSNLWLGSGLFPLASATDPRRPLRIAVGTDIGAGTTFSMFGVLNDAYKVGMLSDPDLAADPDQAPDHGAAPARCKLSAAKALYLATLGGARALRLDGWLGNFDPGREADFLVVDPGATAPPPDASACARALFALIARGDSRAVDETWVFGERAHQRAVAGQARLPVRDRTTGG